MAGDDARARTYQNNRKRECLQPGSAWARDIHAESYYEMDKTLLYPIYILWFFYILIYMMFIMPTRLEEATFYQKIHM